MTQTSPNATAKSATKTATRHREIIIGEPFKAGKVFRKDVNTPDGERQVWFDCDHCPLIGHCLFRYLVSGRQKSCGCGKTEQWSRYHNTKVNAMQTKDRKALCEATRLLGPYEAAKQFGISKATVDFAMRDLYSRMTNLAASKHYRISQAAQISVFDAAVEFKMTATEVLAVCTLARQGKEVAIAAAKAAWDAMPQSQREEVTKALTEAKDQIDGAIEAVCDGEEFRAARYAGELNSEEFKSSDRKYSWFQWVYALILIAGPDVSNTLLGSRRVTRFMEITETTIYGRQARKAAHLKKIAAGTLEPCKRLSQKAARRGLHWHPGTTSVAQLAYGMTAFEGQRTA